MTCTQAAKIIGCSPQQVRYLIRNGTIKAAQVPWRNGDGKVVGYAWNISKPQAVYARDHRPKPGNPGKPKGAKR